MADHTDTEKFSSKYNKFIDKAVSTVLFCLEIQANPVKKSTSAPPKAYLARTTRRCAIDWAKGCRNKKNRATKTSGHLILLQSYQKKGLFSMQPGPTVTPNTILKQKQLTIAKKGYSGVHLDPHQNRSLRYWPGRTNTIFSRTDIHIYKT